MTKDATAAEPSDTSAPETDAENISDEGSGIDESLFKEFAAKANARLGSGSASPVDTAAARGEDPPDPEEETDTETAAQAAVSTSEAAASDAATEGKGKTDEPSDDEILAHVPEKLRPQVEAKLKREREERARLEAANKDLDHKFRSEKGRAEAALRRGQTAAQGKKSPPPETKAAWEAFEKKYPDVAKGMKAFFELQGGDAEDQKALLQFVAKQRVEAELKDAYAAVEKEHPGWIETVNTPEFQEWKDRQPAKVKAWADSDDPEDARLLLDRYTGRGRRGNPSATEDSATADDKAAQAATAAAEKSAREAAALAKRRDAQRDGARTATSRAGASPDTSLDPNAPDAMFRFYADKANSRLRAMG